VMKVIEDRQAARDREDAEALETAALIKEARQRQHRRWLVIGMVVLVVLVASAIRAASGGRSATKPPSSSKPVPVKTASAAGSAGNRHADPLQLVGIWRVIATGTLPAPIVSVSSLGLLVWTSCGSMFGTWNADQQGLFVGLLGGGPPSCLLGPRSRANLNPKWLTAMGYARTGHDELLLGANGTVLARLVPTTVPRALAKGLLPAYLRPVVTPALREALLRVNRPLPSGLAPALARQVVGRWVPANPVLAHRPQAPYLSFSPNGNWSGSDGCNGLGGRWSIGPGGILAVVSGGQTLVGCHNVNLGESLSEATRAAFQGRTLVLVSAAGKVTSRLRRE